MVAQNSIGLLNSGKTFYNEYKRAANITFSYYIIHTKFNIGIFKLPEICSTFVWSLSGSSVGFCSSIIHLLYCWNTMSVLYTKIQCQYYTQCTHSHIQVWISPRIHHIHVHVYLWNIFASGGNKGYGSCNVLYFDTPTPLHTTPSIYKEYKLEFYIHVDYNIINPYKVLQREECEKLKFK